MVHWKSFLKQSMFKRNEVVHNMITNLSVVIFNVLVHGISTRVKMMISNDMMSREWELGKSLICPQS